jgi:hypothetical protein
LSPRGWEGSFYAFLPSFFQFREGNNALDEMSIGYNPIASTEENKPLDGDDAWREKRGQLPMPPWRK